ncbi:MAG: DUF4214 domain-containing protein [Pseudomonadota bacterium]
MLSSTDPFAFSTTADIPCPAERDAGDGGVTFAGSRASSVVDASAPPGYVISTVSFELASSGGAAAWGRATVFGPSDGTGDPGEGPSGTPAGPIFQGTPGDDRFQADAALSGTYLGLGGTDTVRFAGSIEDVSFARLGIDAVVVMAREDDGAALLTGIERIEFDDAVVSYAFEGPALDDLYRLYLVAFGRLPDEAGLSHWHDALRGGLTLDELADRFADSLEFRERIGTFEDGEVFVRKLYLDGMGREADAGGLDYWVGVLERGMIDESEMLRFFAMSEETAMRTEPMLEDGVLLLL